MPPNWLSPLAARVVEFSKCRMCTPAGQWTQTWSRTINLLKQHRIHRNNEKHHPKARLLFHTSCNKVLILVQGTFSVTIKHHGSLHYSSHTTVQPWPVTRRQVLRQLVPSSSVGHVKFSGHLLWTRGCSNNQTIDQLRSYCTKSWTDPKPFPSIE